MDSVKDLIQNSTSVYSDNINHLLACRIGPATYLTKKYICILEGKAATSSDPSHILLDIKGCKYTLTVESNLTGPNFEIQTVMADRRAYDLQFNQQLVPSYQNFSFGAHARTLENTSTRIVIFAEDGSKQESNWLALHEEDRMKYNPVTGMLIIPSFTPVYPTLSPLHRRIPRNGSQNSRKTFLNFFAIIIEVIETKNISMLGNATQKSFIINQQSKIVKHDHALSIFAEIYKHKTFSDAQIQVKPKNDNPIVSIATHKAVLAASSKVFEKMLTTIMKENVLSIIEIVDFEPEVINDALQYLYTGELNMSNHALELLRFGDKYDIQKLVELCQGFIAKNIAQYGMKAMLELLDTYEQRIPILKEAVKDYYKKNEATLKKTEEFQSAIREFPDVFVNLYISETIQL